MSRSAGGAFVLLAVAFVATVEGAARAEEAWLLTADVAAGHTFSEPARSLFGPGASVAAGAYRSFAPGFVAGPRLRLAGFLDADAKDPSRADPGSGGIASLLLAARVRPLARGDQASRAMGLWLELAGGGGFTGTNLRPMAEGGIGYGFGAGSIVVGPTLRYLQIVQSGSGLAGNDAKLGLLGVEVTWLDPRPAPPPPPAASPAPPPPPADTDGDGLRDPDDRCPTEAEDKDGFEDQDGCPDKDNDKDGIADGDDRCPNQPETVNGVDDQDGCPDHGLIELVDDRVVLEDRVLFETDQTRISSSGRRALTAVVTLWKQHKEWDRLEVEGHADQRGTAEYNQKLSESRAARVRSVLIELGLAQDKVTSHGFGSTRPRAQGRSPEDLQANRRVELVVVRKIEVPATPPTLQPPGVEQPTRPNPYQGEGK
jgi:outer membrane protein OmpA-like peptidoglycan-associated protein